jgi:hypothetical protein
MLFERSANARTDRKSYGNTDTPVGVSFGTSYRGSRKTHTALEERA